MIYYAAFARDQVEPVLTDVVDAASVAHAATAAAEQIRDRGKRGETLWLIVHHAAKEESMTFVVNVEDGTGNKRAIVIPLANRPSRENSWIV